MHERTEEISMQRLLPALHESIWVCCSSAPLHRAGGWAGRKAGMEAGKEGGRQAGRDGGRRAGREEGLPAAGAQLCHCQHCRAFHRNGLALPAEESHNSQPLVELPS